MKDINGRELEIDDICVVVDNDTNYVFTYHYFPIGQIVKIVSAIEATGSIDDLSLPVQLYTNTKQIIRPEHIEFMSKF